MQDKARLIGMVCAECQEPIIQDRYVTALDSKRWHTPCFKCARCKTTLTDFYYEQVRGLQFQFPLDFQVDRDDDSGGDEG